jgi:carbon-monoxide dehydrogenase medium subunit
MLRELRSYQRPKELREALALLGNAQVKTAPLAGGSELLGRQDTEIEAVVDLQDLPLNYVMSADEALRIGALTRLQALVTHPFVRAFADSIVARAAEQSAQLTERTAGTVGGTLAAGSSAHDLLVALLACDASLTLQSLRQTRSLGLLDFLRGHAQYLTSDVLITELALPAQPHGARFALERVARTPHDRAIVSVAARATANGGRLRDVRVAAGGVGERPIRLNVVEAMLEGASPGAAALSAARKAACEAVQPESNHIASGEYRHAMVGVLVQRAFEEIGGGEA